jgi:nitroreductase
MLSVEEAITGRRSIRAFLPKPVPREIIGKILLIAGRAPSGTNIQPWKVWVLDGKVRDQVVGEMKAGHDAGDNGRREYHYDMQNWREPYFARRRACGFGLYNTIGIPRGDKERMRAQQGRNYQFFDAPVGIDLLDRSRPGDRFLGRLWHVPAVDHGRRAYIRTGDLPAGRALLTP